MCIENKLSSQGIHYLRYLMSWVKIGGNFEPDPYWDHESGKEKYMGSHGFRMWLRELGLPEEECQDIGSMAGMGKLELESHARKFLNKMDVEP